MNYKELSKGILISVSVILFVTILCYFLWAVRSVLAYIFISFAISLIGRPVMNFINGKLKFSKTLSAIITMGFIFTVFISLFLLFIPLAVEQATNLSLLDTQKLQETISYQLGIIDEYLQSKNIFLFGEDYSKYLTPRFEYQLKPDALQDSFTFLGEVAISIFAVIFISFFFLREKDLFNQIIIGIVPTKDEAKTILVISVIKNLLTRYFLGLCLQVFSMFILYITILVGFKIENTILIAILCAFLNLIPYLGPLVGFFIFTILSLSSMFLEGLDFNSKIFINILWIGGFYMIAQVIDNLVFQPLIYAKSVKSHPLEIFIVMLIAGILFGILGIIFAVPGYTVLRVILKNFFNKFKIVQSITKNI